MTRRMTFDEHIEQGGVYAQRWAAQETADGIYQIVPMGKCDYVSDALEFYDRYGVHRGFPDGETAVYLMDANDYPIERIRTGYQVTDGKHRSGVYRRLNDARREVVRWAAEWGVPDHIVFIADPATSEVIE